MSLLILSYRTHSNPMLFYRIMIFIRCPSCSTIYSMSPLQTQTVSLGFPGSSLFVDIIQIMASPLTFTFSPLFPCLLSLRVTKLQKHPPNDITQCSLNPLQFSISRIKRIFCALQNQLLSTRLPQSPRLSPNYFSFLEGLYSLFSL